MIRIFGNFQHQEKQAVKHAIAYRQEAATTGDEEKVHLKRFYNKENFRPDCDTLAGNCQCKQNVEGRNCEKCKEGFFQIDATNEFGCTPCFCYGHSKQCHMAQGYVKGMLINIYTFLY